MLMIMIMIMIPLGIGAAHRIRSMIKIRSMRICYAAGAATGFALAPERASRTLATAPRQKAHVAEWQTRTAQDRMGKPVEVRLLS
jgi:hypothetical protein